jgi:hypothetical protein
MLIKGLLHICNLGEPANLPRKGFTFRPCPRREAEDLDEDVLIKGIDVFGQYDPTESLITLCMCRMRRFATRHGFQFEDVVTIVLIHELAHFVTHRGKSGDCESWAIFEANDSETEEESKKVIEDMAQQATHLYLRVARYGRLVQVFDSLSNDSPDRYKAWRHEWKNQTKPPTSKNYLNKALEAFQGKLAEERKKRPPERADIHEITGYDE